MTHHLMTTITIRLLTWITVVVEVFLVEVILSRGVLLTADLPTPLLLVLLTVVVVQMTKLCYRFIML